MADLEIPCQLVDGSGAGRWPKVVCTPDDTCGASSCVCHGLSAGSEHRMGVMNAGSVQLVSKPGSSGCGLSSCRSAVVDSANVPRRARDGASSITLRFEMDGRYRPKLYGGNPCPNASPTYNCSLCTTGAWDYRRAIAPILTTPLTNSKPVP